MKLKDDKNNSDDESNNNNRNNTNIHVYCQDFMLHPN